MIMISTLIPSQQEGEFNVRRSATWFGSSYVALKRTAEDKEGSRHTWRMSEPARQQLNSRQKDKHKITTYLINVINIQI